VNVFQHELQSLQNLFHNSSSGEFREFYNLDGTPAGGHQQLWSASCYLSMIFHGLFGMNFEESGIRFDPLVPSSFPDSIALVSVLYRDMALNITIEGSGMFVKQFYLDGSKQSDAFVPGDLTGSHSVRIVMSTTPPTHAGERGVVSAQPYPRDILRVSKRMLLVTKPGIFTVKLVDAHGREVTFIRMKGNATAKMTTLKAGAYIADVNSGMQSVRQKTVLY
jgi:hypothetical protein